MTTEPVPIDVVGPAGPVPTLLFLPAHPEPSRPLVLFGHGANLGKDHPVMQLICRTVSDGTGAVVAAIDCPEHGERRAPDLSDPESEERVSNAANDPRTHTQLTAEWAAVIAAARPHAPGRVAYVGFSMGAIFGFTVVPNLPEVVAAMLALGGLSDEAGDAGRVARNRLVRESAVVFADREVLMLNMSHDESFPMDGALEAFDLLSGPKRMHVFPGGHWDIPPEALDGGIAFLRRVLAPPTPAP